MKIINLISIIVLLLAYNVNISTVKSQNQQSIVTDIKSGDINNLSDAQVLNIYEDASKSGMTNEQIEAAALAKGVSLSEIIKLKARYERLKAADTTVLKKVKEKDEEIISMDTKGSKTAKTSGNFGFSLFTSKNLSFEPSTNIATPKNYQLGPSDKIIIDVWGTSQETYNQKISSDGSINITGIGPIYLSGMTIEEASIKVRKELSSIYSGLLYGDTHIKLTLSEVRSIKVNLVGDVAVPGTYTISSLSTVFNALYIAGGPSENGSLRNIKVVRDNKTIATIDVYDFLLKGEQSNNIRLQDQDVIFVPSYTKRVMISGEVKRSDMYYDVNEKETLKDLIYFAGGYTGKAYTERIKIYRKTGKQYRILDLSYQEADTSKLNNGDEVIIDPILSFFENRVRITGAVMRPGSFAIDSVLTLKQLISKADGWTGDAFKSRILIYRLQEDMTLKVIPIDLSELYKSNSDINLIREDIVDIPSIFDINENFTIQINGEVNKPGVYPYVMNSTVEDVILQAGGLLESASLASIEIARRIKNDTSTVKTNVVAEIFKFQISKDLNVADSASKFLLKPYDQIFIRRSPGYAEQELVSVHGEIMFPGNYSIITTTERISDLVKRAGSITNDAYIEGATLTRKFLEESAIGINLEKILRRPGSKEDLYLQKGDILKIPKKIQTVTVKGAVSYPINVRYDAGYSLRKYISGSGGFLNNAKKSKTYVIYANGTLRETTKLLFFNNYPKVKPGAVVVVPYKPENKDKPTTAEYISYATAISSFSLIILSIINILK